MVYLIGAGPGDPGLLTVRGRACLKRAHVVVYDYLVNAAILDDAPSGAEIIDAGKRKGEQTVSQEAINTLLIDRAQQGRIVARLKGGDPFIFGRGGEEALALAEAGVPFEVVPGVTSVVAVPAYAGIPLTHRDYAATVALATGHEDAKKSGSTIPWDDLASTRGTLVFVMGMTNVATIAEQLVQRGRSPDTPVAVIRWGTYPRQQTVVGTLATIPEDAARLNFQPPGLIVVGEVVALRERLAWFERRPLFGRTVIVTRPKAQSAELIARLNETGAEVVEAPVIALVPPASWDEVDRAIAQMSRYRWVVFTSVNAVRFFFDRLFARNRDSRSLGEARVAVIGEQTAAAVREYGIVPDAVADESTGEGLAATLSKEDLAGTPILFPRARAAREHLPETLVARGAHVDLVTVYETRAVGSITERARTALTRGKSTIVTFTSGSTVMAFLEALGPDADRLMRDVTVACLGPVTAEVARARGLVPRVQPARQSMAAFVAALIAEGAA